MQNGHVFSLQYKCMQQSSLHVILNSLKKMFKKCCKVIIIFILFFGLQWPFIQDAIKYKLENVPVSKIEQLFKWPQWVFTWPVEVKPIITDSYSDLKGSVQKITQKFCGSKVGHIGIM